LEATVASERIVGAAEFKARCLQLMEEVQRTRQPLVVTKRGKPLVRLTPAARQQAPVFGALKGTVAIHGDIVAPIDVEWEAGR
jgi:prevent-host-death family protein